jgi:hypothetical protein
MPNLEENLFIYSWKFFKFSLVRIKFYLSRALGKWVNTKTVILTKSKVFVWEGALLLNLQFMKTKLSGYINLSESDLSVYLV